MKKLLLILLLIGVVFATAPVMETLRISPTSPLNDSSLVGYCNGSDGDGHDIVYYWNWYKNGTLNSSGNGSMTFSMSENVGEGSICGDNYCDGDWNTGVSPAPPKTYDFVYNKPADAHGAIWQVKADNPVTTQNFSIPDVCFNASALSISMSSNVPVFGSPTHECGHTVLETLGTGSFYEEGVWWNISSGGNDEGTEVNVETLTAGNVTAGENWTLECIAFDGESNSSASNVSVLIYVSISNRNSTAIGSTSSFVNWTTDGLANSSVKWGTSVSSMPSSSSNASYDTFHNLTLTGLVTSTEYYYNVTSCTVFGACTEVGPYSLLSAAQGEGETIIVSAPGLSLIWVLGIFLTAIVVMSVMLKFKN